MKLILLLPFHFLTLPSLFTVLLLTHSSSRNIIPSLYKVNFTSQLGHAFSFDEHGDTNGEYVLHRVSIDSNSSEFKQIGEWRNSGFQALNRSIAEEHTSSCSYACPEGWGASIEKEACCQLCKQCTGDEYSSNITGLCEKCPQGSRTTMDNTHCIYLKRKDYRLTESSLGIAAICMTSTGILLVAIIMCVLYKHRDTHIVRASSKEITAVLLVGIALAYATLLITVTMHDTSLCQVYMFSTGLSFSLMAGALFTKTNRTYRIFRKQVMRNGNVYFGQCFIGNDLI